MVNFINLLGNKYESNPNLGIQNFFIGSTSILPNKNLTETFAGMKRSQPIKCQCCHHIETGQLICIANQSTDFYMKATLAFNGLTITEIQKNLSFSTVSQSDLSRHINLNNKLHCKVIGGFITINPFVSNAPFLYPLKTSENRKVF